MVKVTWQERPEKLRGQNGFSCTPGLSGTESDSANTRSRVSRSPGATPVGGEGGTESLAGLEERTLLCRWEGRVEPSEGRAGGKQWRGQADSPGKAWKLRACRV